MKRYDELLEKAQKRDARVTVLGLGYIGLPTALFYASRGMRVRGVDTSAQLVKGLREGRITVHEEGLKEMAQENLSNISLQTTYNGVEDTDVCILCLPSPIDERGLPITVYLENAVIDLARRVKRGCLVLNESTVPVGTTRSLAQIFSQTSGIADDDFWFAHCPERVLPGKVIQEFDTNHRLAGGTNEDATLLATAFLRSVFSPELVHATYSEVSEAAKLAENAFRDVNIGFANELAKLCHSLSIDVSEVISLANLHPRVSILNPGLGVGGYCLPKDGWILVESARTKGGDAQLIPAARHVNDSMPSHVAGLIWNEVQTYGRGVTIGLLGLAFKEDVSDTRNSPTLELMKQLELLDVEIVAHDPLVEEPFGARQVSTVKDLVESSDVLVLCVGHRQMVQELRLEDLTDKIVFDPKHVVPDLKGKVRKYIGLSL